MQETGESCARLLSADREAGLVCAVVGGQDLYCVGGFADWDQNASFPVRLPEKPKVFSLWDDASSFHSGEVWGGVSFCMLNEQGAPYCTGRPLGSVVMSLECSDIATDTPDVCLVCDGNLLCSYAQLSSEVSIVEISDLTVYWLGVNGTFESSERSPVFEGEFVDIFVDSFQLPCAIRDNGALVCALPESDAPQEIEGDFVRGAAGVEQRCAITSSGTISCFEWNEAKLVDSFAPPGDGFIQLVATTDKVCALHESGDISCWNQAGMLKFGEGPFL